MGEQEVIPPQTPFNKSFLDLLRRIFVYDPRRRITAKEALKHPWFSDGVMDDGTEALKLRLAKEEGGRRGGYQAGFDGTGVDEEEGEGEEYEEEGSEGEEEEGEGNE